ncbi:long-chain fatty acid--CoA ligase [Planomonospora sphaerica]|uniref:Long-chain fatty acid--CoA ligase n=1 Tax=Planomonospora sphaerica TaxID=161355 RepID=A0A161MEZ7_9ACTN|nr:long-chain fatty acid--CoA ligase [Planomonospora sphaerica]GAT70763.1 long-chain fatty acid--CoA ligase [Planomonospora sphaerica]
MQRSSGVGEWRTPPAVSGEDARDAGTALDDVFVQAARWPDRAAVSRKAAGVWTPLTWGELAEQVVSLARGLIAAGVRPGDRVALMSATRLEWALCDFAIWAAGAVTVPIYETSSADQVGWIFADSGAVAVFAGDDRCEAVVRQAEPSAVRQVWHLDRLGEVIEPGSGVPVAEVESRRRELTAGDLATIVYTSGTTGPAKGCMITHANLVAEVRNVTRVEGVGELVLHENASVLLFLPLAHVFARAVQLAALHRGVLVGYSPDMKDVPAELRAFRPTLMLIVPRVLEKAYNAALLKAESEGHGKLFAMAADTAVAYSRALDRGGPGPFLRLRRAVFDRLVYAKLRAAMGGRARHAVSGAAPLGVRLGHFMRGAGITVVEGWGLTESTSGHTLNPPARPRMGTVGPPLPGYAVRVAPDGELLLKGPNVFRGYWRNPEATAEAFDADGWLRTGDLGELDADGFVRVTGRKKEIIVTASGKNVAPAVIEDRLRAHWLVDQCVVVGEGRPYVGALVTVDPESFPRWKHDHGKPPEAELSELRDDPDLLRTIQEAVDVANRAVSRAEAVKRFRLLEGVFTVGRELTPTQKVRRHYVLDRYAHEVDALYGTA